MEKRTRIIILTVCIALFLIVSPWIVLYSMGYKINFETMEILATGGIYIRTTPQASEVIIDEKMSEKPKMFSDSVFVLDLIPKEHSILVKKEGYFDYQKTIEVKEKEVTKLENIVLFKKNINIEVISQDVEQFFFSPDKKNVLAELTNTKSLDFEYFKASSPNNKKTYSLALKNTTVSDLIWSENSDKAIVKTQNLNGIFYYLLDFSKEIQATSPLSFLSSSSSDISFNPQNSEQIFYIKNKTLYSSVNNKTETVIKNLVSYKIENNNILWLSPEGILSKSDISGKTSETLIKKENSFPISQNCDIKVVGEKIFLMASDALYEYDSETMKLKDFGVAIDNCYLLRSPDSKNMVYYNNSGIYLYTFIDKTGEKVSDSENNIKIFSSNYPETITDCYWLNNDYIIFQSGNKIIVSEIDYRGNINQIQLPLNFEPSPDSRNPQIFFNTEDNKVYVLIGGTLYSSEKLIQ